MHQCRTNSGYQHSFERFTCSFGWVFVEWPASTNLTHLPSDAAYHKDSLTLLGYR
jgi:hypothetical protein